MSHITSSHPRTRLAAAAATTVIAIGSLTACAGQTPAGTPDAEELPIPLTGAIWKTNGSAVIYTAIRSGYGEKYGLDLDFEYIDNGAAAISQLMSGEVDFAGNSFFAVVDANLNGLDISAVAPMVLTAPDYMTIEALPDSGIDSVEDLVGKTVAVTNLNSAQDMKIKYALLQADIDPEEVTFVELPFSEVPAALERGTVDAGILNSTFQVTAREELDTQVVLDLGGGLFDGFTESGVLMRRSFIADNPETVARFQCALADSANALLESDDVYTEVAIEDAGLDVDTVANTGKPLFAPTLDHDAVQVSADMMQALGTIDDEFDVSQVIVDPPEDCASLVVE